MSSVLAPLAAVLLLATVVGIVYLSIAIWRVLAFQLRPAVTSEFAPPVTLFKPICGLEPELYDNLMSFCRQEYPAFQVIFGVHSAADPAIGIIEHVMASVPQCDCRLIIGDGKPVGNPKVANLKSMVGSAQYDILVIADADMRVNPQYLRAVAAPFARSQVGAVTALYAGSPSSGRYSGLAAMCISEQFMPSVLVALTLERLRYCFGSTMAVRRTVLDSIGGLDALSPYLADDYMLGRRVAECGFEVALASTLVRNVVSEPTFASLWAHQLRWARTIRTARPLGYAGSFVTFPVALAVLYLATSWNVAWGLPLMLVGGALTITLHYATRAAFGVRDRAAPWLAPIRDLLGCVIWVASYFGRDVRWRDAGFSVNPDGRV